MIYCAALLHSVLLHDKFWYVLKIEKNTDFLIIPAPCIYTFF